MSITSFVRLILTPNGDAQKKINEIIFNELVRKVTTDKSKQYLLESIDELSQNGAQGRVLGCNELPFIIQHDDITLPLFNSTVLHAQKALDLALEK